MAQEHHYDPDDVPYLPHHSPWHEQPGYHFHHHPPPQQYGYSYAPAHLPLENGHGQPTHVPRSTHQQLQPLVVPPWPSTLTASAPYTAPGHTAPGHTPTQQVPLAPASAPPSAPPSLRQEKSSRATSTPRKTLTDADRRRMCLYHEENPTKKQEEIGKVFGVERSTVSKVLRHKEKFLQSDEGSKSPARKKGNSSNRFPDLERALFRWAEKQLEKGVRPSDESIRKQARFFAKGIGGVDHQFDVENNTWLEKFKQKIYGPKSRRRGLNSQATPPTNHPFTMKQESVYSPTFLSRTGTPIDQSEGPSRSLHGPFHSQSNASLSSAFTDSGPPLFSCTGTNDNSPIFTPTSEHVPELSNSTFFPSQPPIQPVPVTQRPRSQTFPQLDTEHYISPPSSTLAETPKLNTVSENSILESPGSEMPPPPVSASGSLTNALGIEYDTGDETPLNHSVSIVSTDPRVASQESQGSSPADSYNASLSASPQAVPSSEDVRRALQVLMFCVQNQSAPNVELHELRTIQRCMEKLQLPGDVHKAELPGGMHGVRSRDFAAATGRRSSNVGL